MPSSPLIFRTTCGQFVNIFIKFVSKHAEYQVAMKTVTLKVCTRTDGALVGLVLSLLYVGQFLVLCGDVELNPGPPKTSCTKQTKLTSGRRTRRSSPDNTVPEPPPAIQSSSSGPTLRDVMDLLCSMNESWGQALDTSQDAGNNPPATETTNSEVPTLEESTDDDLMSVLKNINCKFEKLQTDLFKLTNMCSKIQNEISNLKKDMTTLKDENKDLKQENVLLKDKIKTIEKKTDYLEFQSKRNNCIFHGVPRKNNETSLDCEEAVCKLLTEKLNITEPVHFDKVRRINNKHNSPIVASFTSYHQKESVLKAKRKLQGSQVFISDDFPSGVRKTRRNLLPFLKEARTAKKKAFMVYDSLVIDGKKFCLHDDGHLQERK